VDLQGMPVPTLAMRSAWLLILLACGAPRPEADGIARALQRGVAPNTTSVLIMRGDAIVYERYFDGATAATLHDTRSATKSLTALAIGIAIERGALPGVGAPAFAYLADLQPFAAAGPLKDAITIEDLLTMSSALDCNDDDERSPGNEENMYPRPVWARWAVDIPVRADYRRDAPAAARSTTARPACSCSARSSSVPRTSRSTSSWRPTCSPRSGSPGGSSRGRRRASR
jgi:CubicO group peptidase (beta-lactamase class C family)